MAAAKFEEFKGDDGQTYLHIQADNGDIIASTEGYQREAGAENAKQVIIEAVLTELIESKDFDRLEEALQEATSA